MWSMRKRNKNKIEALTWNRGVADDCWRLHGGTELGMRKFLKVLKSDKHFGKILLEQQRN